MLTSLALAAPALHHWGPPFFIFPFFFLFPLVIIVLIVLFAGLGRRRWHRQWAMNGGHPYGPWASASRGAEATLAERFANGDIDEKEYRARLEVLRANRQQ